MTKHQIDAIAISSSEYVRRLGDQNTWQQGGQRAYSDQMLRSAVGNQLANRLLGRKNASAGLPPLYVRPEPTDPSRYSSEATALTTQMALRNLHSLVNALESVGKSQTRN